MSIIDVPLAGGTERRLDQTAYLVLVRGVCGCFGGRPVVRWDPRLMVVFAGTLVSLIVSAGHLCSSAG
jgi:hypothetical protein